MTKIDSQNIRQVILDFPQQFAQGFQLAKNIKVKEDFKSICVSGMGGSSLPADILKAYVPDLRERDPQHNKPFAILKNRGYKLPLEAYKNCLNIFCSYSGNTEETLESLNEAIKNNLPSIGIANDGKLIDICHKSNIPVIILPKVSQPRYATGYFFSVLLQIAANGSLIKKDFSKEILASINKLEEITQKLETKGKNLAQKLFKKTPVIHTSEKFKSVGRIWKIKINENAKTPCFYNYYSELNHNEMVGFTLPQTKFHVITLFDKKAHPQIIKRMKITTKLFNKKGLETTLIDIPNNENFFLSLFSSLVLADWSSYYLALAYNQDPAPVDMVEDLKELLK